MPLSLLIKLTPPQDSLSPSMKRERRTFPADGFWEMVSQGSGKQSSPPVMRTWGHGDGLVSAPGSGGERVLLWVARAPPRPRAPVQDALPHHRPTCPHHEPTRAHNPPMSSTSPLSEHTSASHSCISVGSVRTLADGCSAAGQATKPFLTGALPCELCGERPVREQNSPVHPKARAPTRTQALRSKPATALQKVCECGIAKG